MTSSFSMTGKTLNSPWGLGDLWQGRGQIAANFGVLVPVTGGGMGLTSNLSTHLPWAETKSLDFWETVQNLASYPPPGDFTSAGNASYAYVINYDDLSIPQLRFTGETGSEKVVINPVPEPSSIALICLALVSLLLASRRKIFETQGQRDKALL